MFSDLMVGKGPDYAKTTKSYGTPYCFVPANLRNPCEGSNPRTWILMKNFQGHEIKFGIWEARMKFSKF